MRNVFRATVRSLVLCLAWSCCAAQPAVSYRVVTPAQSDVSIPEPRPAPDLGVYTVSAVREKLPRQYTGRSAYLFPMHQLYLVPYSNIFDMNRLWKKNDKQTPVCIVLGRGSYTLDMVYQQINDPAVLAKDGENSYVLSQPLYIAPTAALVLRDGDWLKLSVKDGTFIAYNGRFFVVDAKVTAWDKTTASYGDREDLAQEQLLMYGTQIPRPYILGLEGSQSYFANSQFAGLGYKGASGTFGISLSAAVKKLALGKYLGTLPPPSGWLIGNRISDLFFGFYSNRASGVVIVGNEFVDNVIYAIDPHDYSDHLIIARNITHRSRLAHGIIISREVVDTRITQNISFNNNGSGIMLDRMSTDNLIADNLVLNNRGDGIAVFESDDNLIQGNHVSRNQRNGIYVRNSRNIAVIDNQIKKNYTNGVEAAVVDIDYIETRDFELDPYHKNTSVLTARNLFDDNFNSAVAVKAADSVTLFANRYVASGPQYFSGDIETHAASVLRFELGDPAPIRLLKTRWNTPGDAGSEQNPVGQDDRTAAFEIVHRLAEQGAPSAMLALGRHYDSGDSADTEQSLSWYARAVQHARPSAMRHLGLLLLSDGTHDEQQRNEGLILLTMAALLDDAKAHVDLRLVPDILGVDSQVMAQAYADAFARLRNGKLWNKRLFPDIEIDMDRRETLSARKRARRVAAEFSRRKKTRDLQQHPILKNERPPIDEPWGYANQHQEDYRRRWQLKNDKKRLRNLRAMLRKKLDEQTEGARRAQLDRKAKRAQSARVRAATLSPEEQQALTARIEQLLDLINSHRSPEARIELEGLSPPLLFDVHGSP